MHVSSENGFHTKQKYLSKLHFYVLSHTHIAQPLMHSFPLCWFLGYGVLKKTFTLFWWNFFNFTNSVLRLLIIICCLWLFHFMNSDSILTLVLTLIRAPTELFNVHFEIWNLKKDNFSSVFNFYSKTEAQYFGFSFFNFLFILKY